MGSHAGSALIDWVMVSARGCGTDFAVTKAYALQGVQEHEQSARHSIVRSVAFLFDLAERCLQGPIIIDIDGHIEVGPSGLMQQQLFARHPTLENLIVAAYIGRVPPAPPTPTLITGRAFRSQAVILRKLRPSSRLAEPLMRNDCLGERDR
jgi:hypothetical protein